MAVKGIGGSRAYVITSRIDPQSTANYYAKLVTSQKYQLWEEAQKIALAEMKQAGATDAMLVKEYQNQREDLRREVADLQELDRKYQLEEVKSAQKIKENKAKFESGIGAKSKGGGGAAGRVVKKQTDDEIVGELTKNANSDVSDKERGLENSRKYKQSLLSEQGKLSKGSGKTGNATRLQQLDDEIILVDKDIGIKNSALLTSRANRGRLETVLASPELKKKEADKYRPEYERIGYIPPTAGTADEKKYVEPEALSLGEQRAQIQSDIAARQAQISGLQAPQLYQFDLLGRTREIARDEFGQAPAQRSGRELVRNYLRGGRQPGAVEQAIEEGGMASQPLPSPANIPSMTAERRAELEALGVDDDFLLDNGIEPELVPPEGSAPVVTGDIDLIRAEAERSAEANYVRPPLLEVSRGYDPDSRGYDTAREELADSGAIMYPMTFEEVRADRASVGKRIRQNEIDLQALGRSEAEAARAQFPNPLPVSEEARRTAITAPMAQGIPRNTFRDLELQAMEMQKPTSIAGGAAKATNELQSVFGIEELINGPAEAVQVETTLTPDVQYRYDRITSSKEMLDNPYSWYSGTSKKDKPDWAMLVEKLYNPKKAKTDLEAMEDLQNAWEQITISYSENRDIMVKAHDYLLFIDRAEEASKKAQ